MDNSKFILEGLNKIAKDISKSSLVPYEDLPQYDLFLSQVIDYLNDRFQEEQYTNNIVQNYIKNEVISKPEDGKKRGYTKLHLAQLVLLSYMRPILTTEEIKKVFALAFNQINDRSDDIISWEKAYKVFDKIQAESLDNFLNVDFFNEDKFNKYIDESQLKEEDKGRILVFLIVMNLIAQASAIKKLAKKIIDDYGDSK
ncbi:MAG: DUF1836 domain-containing protein [Clostridium sp.]|nr:DUF1836 domain-containing protein [Clostridium sp.]